MNLLEKMEVYPMKVKHLQKNAGMEILSCLECGHEITQVEFHHSLKLCDHLALDALALHLKKRGNPPES